MYMQTILIGGGSGLIGSDLQLHLAELGYRVRILSRKKSNPEKNIFNWNIDTGYIDPQAFDGVDCIINLAGSSIIGGRWTPKRKIELTKSRVQSTQLLVNTINENTISIKHFIQASAMGYYGNCNDKIITEDSPQGNDFMGQLCGYWEAASNQLNPNIKKSILRIGLYMSARGGVYAILARLAKFHILSGFGHGQMWAAYTHHQEFSQLTHQIIQGDIPADTYNAVGHQPFQMKDLIRVIAAKNRSKAWLPNIPAVVLKTFLGEASATLLNSYRVTSPKLSALKKHSFSSLNEAIQQV